MSKHSSADPFLTADRMRNYCKIAEEIREQIRQRGAELLPNHMNVDQVLEVFEENPYMGLFWTDDRTKYSIHFFGDIDELKTYCQESLGGGWWLTAVYSLDTGHEMDYCWKLEVS